MKTGLYFRLARMGIRRSRRTYLPYFFTCVGMTAMFYIIASLASSPSLADMAGGRTLDTILGFGTFVMALFAVIFLFYTNSFLIRRRKKEFGLYNILGMSKKNIAFVLLWETVITYVASLTGGLFFGILLSKAAELCLVNLTRGTVRYDLSISPFALSTTAVLFGAVFFLILLSGLWQIRLNNPVALLRSENAGEKPPRANYLLGVGGAVLLAAAYWMAVTVANPIQAITEFFVAVMLVIVATFLLFIAGSVMLCRLLQKNKSYYYRPAHFVSVSSMAFRMKRNGAGLASICILATMVLVTLTGSGCLYFGVEDSLRTRYPTEFVITAQFDGTDALEDSESVSMLESVLDRALARAGCEAKGRTALRQVVYPTLSAESLLTGQPEKAPTEDRFFHLNLIPLADYAALAGSETLAEHELLLYSDGRPYPSDAIVLGGETFSVKRVLDSFPLAEKADDEDPIPSLFLVIGGSGRCGALAQADYLERVRQGRADPERDGGVNASWICAFDTGASSQMQAALTEELRKSLGSLDDAFSASITSRAANRSEFLTLYGGLFFLGLLLSIAFSCATVLIIYYKQLSEGLEDQARFDIMKKVGMTARDIRKSVNSQMLTVFFLPLAAAVLHLCFAFPMLHQMLQLFDLKNLPLLLTTAGICAGVFALLYVLVYRATSNAYFRIVSGTKDPV